MTSPKYTNLETEKAPFLRRARECAKLTLPMVIRPDRSNGNTAYDTPFQSVGGRGVSSLASNLLLSLFPASTPFFRLLISKEDMENFENQEEITEVLAKIERTVLEDIEGKNLRSTIMEALKNLLIAGNTLVYVEPEGTIRNYTIEDYVVHRDMSGNVTDLIVVETISSRVALNLGIISELSESDEAGTSELELYTYVELSNKDTFNVWQEINGVKVAGTDEEYAKEDLPWIPIRLTKVTGESYGRSYVETIIGDLKSLEALQKAIIEVAAITSRVIFMVLPGTTTQASDIESAENGDVINGSANDVTTLQVNKSGDLSLAIEASRVLEQRLSYSFNLLDSTLPTKGQTTAYEVGQIVNSLEKVLTGVYAILSSEFMLPLVTQIIERLSKQDKIPELPKEVKLIISTGLTALGRNSDIERIMTFSQMASQVSPEAYAALVDVEKLLRQLEAAIGSDVLKSVAQVEAEREAARQAQEQAQQQEQINQAIEQLPPSQEGEAQ